MILHVKTLATLLACFTLSANAFASDPVCRYVFDNSGTARDAIGHLPEMKVTRGTPIPGYDKGGIRLDDASLSTREVILTNAFTVCTWVRPIAFGSKAFGRSWPNGMIANCGSGYYEGWRLLIQENERFRPVFEIGREGGSVSVTSGQGLSTSTWHMVAGSWGRNPSNELGVLRLYVDGRLMAESKNEVAAPLSPKAPLSIGYTDFGVGSMLMDFGELTLYDRELTALEIQTLFGAARYEQNLATPFHRAETLGLQAMMSEETNTTEAKQKWSEIMEDTNVDIIHRIIAAEKSGDRNQLTTLLENPEAPAFLKMRHEMPGFSKLACTLDGKSETALPEKQLFVATTGRDANIGSESSPFASLERARDEVRKLRADGFQHGIAVILAAGHYERTSTFTLDAKDSASAGARVVYAAKPGTEEVVFDGGIRIQWNQFSKMTDETTLAKVTEDARGRILVADLPRTSAKPPAQKSFGIGELGRSILMLTVDDQQIMRPARWPNDGFIQSTKTPDSATGLIPLDGDRAKRWMSAQEPMAHGYWMYTWADAALPVAFVETNNTYALKLRKTHTYGLGKTPSFYVFNMLEELDAPGEWFYDEAGAKLYMIPLEGASPEYLTLSALETPLVTIDGAHHVEFRGISFRNTRSDAVKISKATNVTFSGCDFRGIGGTALVGSGCDAFTLKDSTFKNMGHGAVEAGAGDRRTLKSGDVRIHGNTFSKVGQFARTYTPGVLMHGVGAVICHNEFFDMPSSAMRIEGNNHIIENNNVHEVVLESDDQGAVDMWGDPSYRRCIFRYNTFRNIGNPEGAPCGQCAIRFDDMISGMIVHDNTFINASRPNFGAVQIHGGSSNIIFANTIRDCDIGISFSPWGKERWVKQLTEKQEIVDKIKVAVDISTPPYSTAYPELSHIRDDVDHNFIWNNHIEGCEKTFHNLPSATELIWNRVEK